MTRPNFTYCIYCERGRNGDLSCAAGFREWKRMLGCYLGTPLEKKLELNKKWTEAERLNPPAKVTYKVRFQDGSKVKEAEFLNELEALLKKYRVDSGECSYHDGLKWNIL